MSYRVNLNDRAEGQLEAAYLWWRQHRSAEQAARWYNGFMDALNSLRENPDQCALARENTKFPCPVHELLYGPGSSMTHRALFTIRPDMVYVFSIRHVAHSAPIVSGSSGAGFCA